MTRNAIILWIATLIVGAGFVAATVEKGMGRDLSAPDTQVSILWAAAWLLALGVFPMIWWWFHRFNRDHALGPLLMWSGLIVFFGLFALLGATFGH